MTLIALCSAKGAPGVTTLACTLGAVWPLSVLVAECDPSGGDLAVRFGLSGRSSVSSYLFAKRDGADAATPGRILDHCQRLPGGLEVLVGALGIEASAAIDRELGQGALFSSDAPDDAPDVIADCGRLLPGAAGQQRLLASADAIVIVTRPDLPGIAHTRLAVYRTKSGERRGDVKVATVGSGPFRAREIAGVLGLDSVFELPDDPVAAAILCGRPGDGRAFGRSLLVARTRHIASLLARGTGQLEPA